MRHTAMNFFKAMFSLAALLGALATMSFPAAAAEGASAVEQGKAIAYDRKKGNCLACHAMDDGTLPGNIGPPLIAMKARFPDKAKLRAQIWDSTVANPNSIMIPFGRVKALSEEEIDMVVEYIYTL
jgi:sulfur-oxidizing protein SoxX